MSTIKVDNIEQYSAGKVSVNNNIEVTGVVGSTTGFRGDQFSISGSSNIQGFQNDENVFSTFNGSALFNNKTGNTSKFWLLRESGSNASGKDGLAEVYIGSFKPDFSIDEALFLKATTLNGIEFRDWAGTWMSTTYGNGPTFQRKVTVNNVLKLTPQNPLPAGSLGELAVSGSNLYFHNGAGWQLK